MILNNIQSEIQVKEITSYCRIFNIKMLIEVKFAETIISDLYVKPVKK